MICAKHTQTHTHTHTHVITYIHTYMHTHTHTQKHHSYYSRALNEISVGLISQPLSVLILDVGSIMVKSDKEIIKVTNQNQNLSTIGIPEMLSTDSSPSSSSIASESISSLTKENINKCADKNEQSKNNCVDLSAKNRDTYWGIGNRASMFILACKVADSIKEGKMLGVAIEPDRSREKDEEVGTVCNSSVVAPNIYDDTLTANEALKEEKENKEDKRNVVAINSDCNKNYSNSNSSSCSNNHDNSSSTRIMNEYTVTDSSPDLDLDSNIPFISDLSRAKETSAKMLADCEVRELIRLDYNGLYLPSSHYFSDGKCRNFLLLLCKFCKLFLHILIFTLFFDIF